MSELSRRRSVRKRDDVTMQQYNNTIDSNVRIVLPTVRTIVNIDSVFLISQDERRMTFRFSSLRNSIVNRLELSNLPQEHS